MMRALLFLSGFIAICLAVASPASAAYADDRLRPEVGMPLREAQDLIRKGSFKAALEQIDKAEAAPDRTASENLLIEELRASTALMADDPAKAIKAYQAAIATGALDSAGQLRFEQGVAALQKRMNDDAEARNHGSAR